MNVITEQEKNQIADYMPSSFVTFLQNRPIKELDSIKDLLLKKASALGTSGLSIDMDFINAIYYDANDLTDISFDMLEVYCNQGYKHQLSIGEFDYKYPRCGIFLMMLTSDTVLNTPYNEEDYRCTYEGLIRLILDIYVPSEDPDDIMKFYIENISIREIMENLHNNNFIQEKINNYQFSTEGIDVDAFLLFKHLSDIWSLRDTKMQVYVDIYMQFHTVYKRVDDMQAIFERYASQFGELYVGSLAMDLFLPLKRESSVYMPNIISQFLDKLDEKFPDCKDIHKFFVRDIVKYAASVNPDIPLSELMSLIDNYERTPAIESFIEVSLDHRLKGLDLAIAREAANTNTNVSQGMHDGSRKIYKAYKVFANARDKIDSQLSKAVQGIKGVLTGDVRSEIIEGKKFSAISLLKKLLGTAAIFSFSKIGGVLSIVVGYALKKKTLASERNKIILELQAELEIIEEKIQDARGDNNREAKYAMMRTKTEIQNAIDKINYGIEADAKSTATAKNLISQVKGGR